VRLLVIGGTSFVGRAVALAALASGHDVTVLNRGVTPSDLPDAVERLVGDRRVDLGALEGRTFDATVDVIAYWPGDVAVLREALGDRGGHHLHVSSISAYAEPLDEGATEAAALWPEGTVAPDAAMSGTTYGPLKAACERAARELFGSDTTVVRPTYVIGGHDATLRFPYWVARCQRGGDVAVPGPRNVALQYVDARDVGEFVVTLVERGTPGAFTTTGPWPPARYVDVVEAVAAQVGSAGTRVVEVAPEVVERLGRASAFPMWGGPSTEAALTMDPSAALAAGLTLRSLADSVDDVVAWWGDREWPEQWLAPSDEAALLDAAAEG
jgi:2'-hydroxyisoflavone reductase